MILKKDIKVNIDIVTILPLLGVSDKLVSTMLSFIIWDSTLLSLAIKV